MCGYQILASFSSLCTAHKHTVNIIKVYIERKNMQVELIRFRKKISPLFTFTFVKPRIHHDSRVCAWIVVTTSACSIVITL